MSTEVADVQVVQMRRRERSRRVPLRVKEESQVRVAPQLGHRESCHGELGPQPIVMGLQQRGFDPGSVLEWLERGRWRLE